MTKPYNSLDEVTYHLITTHPYFRNLTYENLVEIIDEMDYDGYEALPGEGAHEKATNLQQSYKIFSPVAPKSIPPADKFGPWDITRTEDDVIFGCGEVTISKRDLLTLATALEDPTFADKARAFYRIAAKVRDHVTTEKVLEQKPEQLIAFTGI